MPSSGRMSGFFSHPGRAKLSMIRSTVRSQAVFQRASPAWSLKGCRYRQCSSICRNPRSRASGCAAYIRSRSSGRNRAAPSSRRKPGFSSGFQGRAANAPPNCGRASRSCCRVSSSTWAHRECFSPPVIGKSPDPGSLPTPLSGAEAARSPRWISGRSPGSDHPPEAPQ